MTKASNHMLIQQSLKASMDVFTEMGKPARAGAARHFLRLLIRDDYAGPDIIWQARHLAKAARDYQGAK